MTKGKVHLKLRKIDASEIEHTLWIVKFHEKASVNLFSWACKFSQEAKMISTTMENIVLGVTDDQIVLNQRIKLKDGRIAKVELI